MWIQENGSDIDFRVRLLKGLRNRIVATLALAVGGVVWLLYYAAFWSTHFIWYQNLAIILSTLLVLPTIIVAMWITWGLGLKRRYWAAWHRESFDTW